MPIQQRTIVSIEPGQGGQLMTKLRRASMNYANALAPYPLPCNAATLPPLDDAAHVQTYGNTLRDSLKQHPAIQSALDNIFAMPAGQSCTLCFEILAQPGETIRWEALCDDQGQFVALSPRCRLGRIADQTASFETGIRSFRLPLRLAAFLSAVKRDARPEWEGLAKAFDNARAAGLGIEARVYIGQQDLLDAIRAEIAAGAHPGISVFAMPASDLDVEKALNDWTPQLVHFFCHGGAEYGKAFLELGTIVDHDTGASEGSVVVEVNSLVEAEGLRSAWLVVLNCCDGATASDPLGSMAFRIVANGNVPAVIGMQEPIPAADANEFCKVLYPEIFRLLGDATMGINGSISVLDVTEVLLPARRAIRNRNNGNPGAFRNWTLPVLYVQRELFQVQQLAAAQVANAGEFRARVNLIAGLLQSLPAEDTPDSYREMILALLDKPPAVPIEMRPNKFGQFSA
jgi:hypothetical protein